MKNVHTILKKLKACEPAIEWAKKYDTIEEIVANVNRGDWLLWLGTELDLPLQEMTLVRARCAKTVIHLIKDKRIRKAVDVAEKFGLGEATLEELRKDTHCASNAFYFADVANTSNAAHYAFKAAFATANNSNAAFYTATASDNVVENRKLTADICREILGQLIIDKVNNL